MDERIVNLDTLCKRSPGDLLSIEERLEKEKIILSLTEDNFYVYHKPHHGSHTILYIKKDDHVYLDALYDVAGEAVNTKGITWPSPS